MGDTYNPKIIFSGDSSGARTAVTRLKSELGSLQSIAAKALGFVGVAVGIKEAIEYVVKLTKAAIDQGDELNKMSQKTGVAVEELSKYRYISDLSGVSNEALTKGLVALSSGMASAATGVGATADTYQKFGINVRNADGTMKTSGAVLSAWADRFKAMPDGVDKTNLAVEIFGKKLGAEMIPMLNLGSEGIKALGDEAEALGLVISGKFAKQAEEFNDNVEKLGKLSSAAGISIAGSLIPQMNAMLAAFLEAKKQGFGVWTSLNSMRSAEEITKQLATINGQIAHYNKLKSEGRTPLMGSYDDEITQLEKQKKLYETLAKMQAGDGVQTAEELAKKRIGIELQMQTKIAELAQLRGIAEGKVSAEILDDDNKRIAAQITNAKKLRDALAEAWNKSRAEALAAGEAAKKLLEQASDTRQTASDKATAKRRSTLSAEDKQALAQQDFENAASSAETNAGLATIAELHGRTENAAKLAAQAAKDADRAAKLAEQIDDPEAAARAIEQAGEIQAKLLESQAKAKQQEQKELEERAKAQSDLINGLDQQITELQTKASAIKVQADIAEAQGAIATLQADLDNIKVPTITIPVNTTNLSGIDTASGTAPGTGQQFAYGGWTGPGSKWQPAGLVHADEFVLRQEVVRQSGAKSFLALFNQIGMRALQGYANGGLVQNLRVQPIAPRAAAQPSGGTPITLVLDGHRMQVTATQSVASEMTKVFQREALKRGIRK